MPQKSDFKKLSFKKLPFCCYWSWYQFHTQPHTPMQSAQGLIDIYLWPTVSWHFNNSFLYIFYYIKTKFLVALFFAYLQWCIGKSGKNTIWAQRKSWFSGFCKFQDFHETWTSTSKVILVLAKGLCLAEGCWKKTHSSVVKTYPYFRRKT